MTILNGISLDGTMKINGISLAVVETSSVTNYTDLPTSAAAGTVYLITATGRYYEYHSTAGWIPSLIAQKTFESAIDSITGTAIPNTLDNWADTTAGSGAIAIDSGAVKFTSNGANSDKAFTVGTHDLSGADWYLRCDVKCTTYSGSTRYSATMIYCYDGEREVRVHLIDAASSGKAVLIGGASATSEIGSTFVSITDLSSFKTLEIVVLSNTCYFFFDGILTHTEEHENFRGNAAEYCYIGDSSAAASAITWIKNYTLWKLT